MNKARLAAVAFGALAIAACDRSDEDRLNTAETNVVEEDLDALSDEAARLAAEAQALEDQAAQLNQEAQSTDANGPETPEDENIAGM